MISSLAQARLSAGLITALGSSFSNRLIHPKCVKERYRSSLLPAHFGLHKLGHFPTHIDYLLIAIHCHTVYNYTVNEHMYIQAYFSSLPFYCIFWFLLLLWLLWHRNSPVCGINKSILIWLWCCSLFTRDKLKRTTNSSAHFTDFFCCKSHSTVFKRSILHFSLKSIMCNVQ